MDNKKESIFSAALELFANKGYGPTTMRDIAKKAGVALGLTYNYYASKEAILNAIVDEVIYDLKKMDRLVKNQDDLKNLIEEFFTMMLNRRLHWKFLMQIILYSRYNEKVFSRVSTNVGTVFHKIEEGFARYSRFPEKLSGVVIHGIVFEFMFSGDKKQFLNYKDIIIGEI